MFEGYCYYAIAIIVMTVISVTVEVVEMRRNLLNIKTMAAYECEVSVLGSNGFQTKISTALIPGDIIEIPEGKRMPCDCVLLEGSVIVNESMLTGESIPVVKVGIPSSESSVYDPEEDKKYTVYSGTDVIQIRSGKTTALVIRTGFSTMKGSLVRYILYPKPSKFSFNTDSYKYIIGMLLMSIIGIIFQFLYDSESEAEEVVIKCLDLITITVPPALPACMSVGINFALNRLKGERVFCISPPRINVAGKVDLFCFDKTGTLTEDGLSIDGYRTTDRALDSNRTFSLFCNTIRELVPSYEVGLETILDSSKPEDKKLLYVECMATCHSVARAKGKLIGDPLDVQMFIECGWKLDEVNGREDGVTSIVSPAEKLTKEYQLGIFRALDFTSRLQRMSTFVKNLQTGKLRLYTKGSPEKIAELSRPETLPSNYSEILTIYTQQGCRVLALATKPLSLPASECQLIERETIEKDLEFLGFLILRNSLKKPTSAVIATLKNANIKPVMITGDNAYTAVTVAKECGILSSDTRVFIPELVEQNSCKSIKLEEVGGPKGKLSKPSGILPLPSEHERKLKEDAIVPAAIPANDLAMSLPFDESDGSVYSLAFTGKVWEYILQKDPKCILNETRSYLERAVVFARMSPESKATLVEAFQNLGFTVGMCGDGANDCVALKGADIGISLSEAEASIAAPFTSRTPDITCVPKVLKEGRAALTTSFQCFKFMALYSMIQYTSACLTYYLGQNLTDYQYLIVDLGVIVPLAITMSWTKAASKLSKQRPISELISWPVLSSVIGQIIIQAACQVL